MRQGKEDHPLAGITDEQWQTMYENARARTAKGKRQPLEDGELGINPLVEDQFMPNQRKALLLRAEGNTDKEIASILGLPPQTVKYLFAGTKGLGAKPDGTAGQRGIMGLMERNPRDRPSKYNVVTEAIRQGIIVFKGRGGK